MERSSWASTTRGASQTRWPQHLAPANLLELHGRYVCLHRTPLTSRRRASSPVVGTIAPGDRVEAVEARLDSGGRTRLRVWARHRGMSLNGWADLANERGRPLLQQDVWEDASAAVSVAERFHAQQADSVSPEEKVDALQGWVTMLQQTAANHVSQMDAIAAEMDAASQVISLIDPLIGP